MNTLDTIAKLGAQCKRIKFKVTFAALIVYAKARKFFRR